MENKVAYSHRQYGRNWAGDCENLASKGAKVVINCRTLEKLKAAESEIEALGGRVLGIQGDATDEAEIRRIIVETEQYFGRIDILVNNAATTVSALPLRICRSNCGTR